MSSLPFVISPSSTPTTRFFESCASRESSQLFAKVRRTVLCTTPTHLCYSSVVVDHAEQHQRMHNNLLWRHGCCVHGCAALTVRLLGFTLESRRCHPRPGSAANVCSFSRRARTVAERALRRATASDKLLLPFPAAFCQQRLFLFVKTPLDATRDVAHRAWRGGARG